MYFKIATANIPECEAFIKKRKFSLSQVIILEEREIIVNTENQLFIDYLNSKYRLHETTNPLTISFPVTNHKYRVLTTGSEVSPIRFFSRFGR